MKFQIKVEVRTHLDTYDRAIPRVVTLYDWAVTPYYKETATYTTNTVLATGTDRSMKQAMRSAEKFSRRYAKAKSSEIGIVSYDYLPGN